MDANIMPCLTFKRQKREVLANFWTINGPPRLHGLKRNAKANEMGRNQSQDEQITTSVSY